MEKNKIRKIVSCRVDNMLKTIGLRFRKVDSVSRDVCFFQKCLDVNRISLVMEL